MSPEFESLRIGFIGAGQMATALASGFLRANCTAPDRLTAFDVVPAVAERFRTATGGSVAASNSAVVKSSDVVVLAVKPQQMADVLQEITPTIESRHLVVSIAAGITLATMTSALGGSCRIIRVMPNTPALIGAGASAFARSGSATADDAALVHRLFSTVGFAAEVPERSLDAVTGLSGSGPAYIYLAIEALSDGGVLMGLPRALALQLAAQTVLGAAQMVLATGQHPGALKDAVTSPGGTTIHGLQALEDGGLRGLFINAVQAATEQARRLS